MSDLRTRPRVFDDDEFDPEFHTACDGCEMKMDKDAWYYNMPDGRTLCGHCYNQEELNETSPF